MRFVFRATDFLVLGLLAFTIMPAPTHAAPPTAGPGTYTVQPGDTLYAIAVRFHTTVATLKQLNGLKSDALQAGQVLKVPSSDPPPPAPPSPAPPSAPKPAQTRYTVQPGDTLARIARRFGTSVDSLIQVNDLPTPNLIQVGDALNIPNSPTLVEPGLTLDPPAARQGSTVMIQVTRPDLVSAAAKINGQTIPLTHSAGYFYGLVGFSRCAKVGSVPLTVIETDAAGKTTTETASITVAATAFTVQSVNLPPGKESLLDPALIKKEGDELAAIVGNYTPVRLWSGPFRLPVTDGIISSSFGMRRSYNGGPVGVCGHEGMDFALPGGVPIHADARGRVVFAGLTQVHGNMVVVDHGLGVFTAYFHQSEMDVQVGRMVEAGDLIGKVGTTGLSTGTHLHWSIWVNSEYVDPVEWTKRLIP